MQQSFLLSTSTYPILFRPVKETNNIFSWPKVLLNSSILKCEIFLKVIITDICSKLVYLNQEIGISKIDSRMVMTDYDIRIFLNQF